MKENSVKYKSLRLYFDTDPILHEKCRKLTKQEIASEEIQQLIDDMKYTCDKENYGVGLSANQVGLNLAISVVAIKPTVGRPNLQNFDKVLINTEIIEKFNNKVPMWEGCLSTARDNNNEPAMALVPRYEKIRVRYYDRCGKIHDEIIENFIAQVVQHETDHLNGVLFTDFIDNLDLISNKQYREMINQKEGSIK